MKHLYLGSFLLVFALLPCANQAQQGGDSSKAAYIGVVYYLDQSAKLVALDRQVPYPNANLKMLGFGGAKSVVELDAERASLRLPSDQEHSFVVELATAVDPREFELYPFAVKDGKRQLTISRASIFRGGRVLLPLQVNISRFGENSYKLTPSSKLAVGEYAFMARGSTEVYCFGVDKKE